jgi:putative membrane protein
MLLKQNLTLYRVFKITWRVDILIILLCTVSYFVDRLLLTEVHIPSGVPALTGTALAFFIAFNNGQAYSRWWEARTVWGGIVNDSRSFCRSVLTYVDASSQGHAIREQQVKMVRRHIGFLYATRDQLRRLQDRSFSKYLSTEDLRFVEKFSNPANAILDLQAADLEDLYSRQRLDGFKFMGINDLIRGLCDGLGKSERINNTVFPTTYIYFTRLFIWIFVILVTMSLAESIGPWSIFFGWIMGFVFHTANLNGTNLVNPFDETPSCVPLNSIVRSIEITLLQALGETVIPDPEPTQRNGEYIL